MEAYKPLYYSNKPFPENNGLLFYMSRVDGKMVDSHDLERPEKKVTFPDYQKKPPHTISIS